MTDELEGRFSKWQELPPEVKSLIVQMTIDDDAWHSLQEMRNLQRVNREMHNLVNKHPVHRLHKVNLDAAMYISVKVFSSADKDEYFSNNWPYASEQIGEISLSSALRAMMPLFETRSPEWRLTRFREIAKHPNDEYKMAGYAELMTRPNLFDEKQRMTMFREAVAVSSGSNANAQHFAGRVLANGFLAFGGEEVALVYRMIATSQPISLCFVEGVATSNPSLFARPDVRVLAQENFIHLDYTSKSTTLHAMAKHMETPSPEEREFIFNNALNLLEDPDLHEHAIIHAALAVSAIARNGQCGILKEFQPRIDNITSEDTDAGRHLRNALSRIDQREPAETLPEMDSKVKIEAAYFHVTRNIDRAIAPPFPDDAELYQQMEEITVQSKIVERHISSSRKTLSESRKPRERDVAR